MTPAVSGPIADCPVLVGRTRKAALQLASHVSAVLNGSSGVGLQMSIAVYYRNTFIVLDQPSYLSEQAFALLAIREHDRADAFARLEECK